MAVMEGGPGWRLAGDHQLVAAVRRGDDRAFEQLYDRYQRRIAGFVHGMVHDYQRSEDITQEVFISALRRIRDTERPIAFRPWIYEIARNACIDAFRRSRRTETVRFDGDDHAEEYAHRAAPAFEPDTAVGAKEQLDHLQGAFAGLSDVQHEMIVMRELEGHSYQEIGNRLGLSRPAVESGLFRARRRLTEEYDELVSGRRCRRIQATIASVDEPVLGAREEARLARHIAHCQPCRRQAAICGFDAVALSRRPVHKRIAAKVGAWLPLPAFLRSRGVPVEMAVPVASEPLANAAGKALAALAAVVVAGAGIGAHSERGGGTGDAAAGRPAPAAAAAVAAGAGSGAAASPPLLGGVSAPSHGVGAGPLSGGPGAGSLGGGGGAAGGAQAPFAGLQPPSGVGGVESPAGDPTTGATPAAGNTVTNAGETVGAAVGGAGQTVGHTVAGAGQAVGNAIGGGAGQTVSNAAGGAGQTVNQVTADTGQAVSNTVAGVGQTLSVAIGSAGESAAAVGRSAEQPAPAPPAGQPTP